MSADDNFVSVISDLRIVLGKLHLTEVYDSKDTKNFIPGSGESIYSTFLRAIGLLRYSENVNAQIPLEQQVAEGQSLVDRLLKLKDQSTAIRKENFLSFLNSLKSQLEKYVRDVNLVRIRRIRKQIGNVTDNPRNDSTSTSVTFTKDLQTNIRLVNEELAKYQFQQKGLGWLVQEIDLLNMFLGTLNTTVNDIVNSGAASAVNQPLGPVGGPFVGMLKAQANGYEQLLNTLVDQRVALNSELRILQNKMRLIRTGLETVTKEPIALLSVVNAILYLISNVKYTCKECRFFGTEPISNSVDLSGIPDDQKKAEQARIDAARKRAETFRKSFAAKGGFCRYRSANIPTTTEYSCNEVWGLVGNDFWRASDNAEEGRIDVIAKAREKLDPRKQ